MTDEVKKTGSGRWVRVALFVSLALNLLVVGVVSGFVLKGPPEARIYRGDPALPYTRAFDEDQRRALRRELGQSMRRDGKAIRAAYLADYQNALGFLRAEPFVAESFEALLKEQGKRGADVRERGQVLLMKFVTEMTTEERRAYADRLEVELERIRQRGGRDGHKKGK